MVINHWKTRVVYFLKKRQYQSLTFSFCFSVIYCLIKTILSSVDSMFFNKNRSMTQNNFANAVCFWLNYNDKLWPSLSSAYVVWHVFRRYYVQTSVSSSIKWPWTSHSRLSCLEWLIRVVILRHQLVRWTDRVQVRPSVKRKSR